MSPLFRRLQPACKFRISVGAIARLLGIPKSSIVRVACWDYVLFVHRRDRGGQFISYRQLEQWRIAIACRVQQCVTVQQLGQLWGELTHDCQKYQKQYKNSVLPFLETIKAQREAQLN